VYPELKALKLGDDLYERSLKSHLIAELLYLKLISTNIHLYSVSSSGFKTWLRRLCPCGALWSVAIPSASKEDLKG